MNNDPFVSSQTGVVKLQRNVFFTPKLGFFSYSFGVNSRGKARRATAL